MQDISLKHFFSTHVLYITYGWLGFLVIVFGLTGAFNLRDGRQFMSDAVLIALISGTSLGAVVGMVSIILKYLFPNGRK